MPEAKFLRNVILKAALLLVVLNVLFAAVYPLPWLGRISAYNTLFPGRERFPFGEDPQQSYNLSLYNLEAMFASHVVSAAPPDEYRLFLLGDSSVWGTLLEPQDTLAGQINAAHLVTCDGRPVRAYNLGYPTLSLTKDLMILDEAMRYKPDAIVWLTTLESFPRARQLTSPIVANQPQRVAGLVSAYGLELGAGDPALHWPSWWERTLAGSRRSLADLVRLQLYAPLWSATGIDQVYPQNYPPVQRDFEADDLAYNGWQPPDLPMDQLAFDVLDAGFRAAGETPILLVNEPMLVSSGQNSDIRYNFFYPRWAYDQYRQLLRRHVREQGWQYQDLWQLLPESEFTNSAIHLTPHGSARLAQRIMETIVEQACRPAG
ncbi:MAG: hypothetical protein VB089_08345 [Anaerolineaceae bacterium]|nr:hypothetical protein [Anaerolineaceae bacterium]